MIYIYMIYMIYINIYIYHIYIYDIYDIYGGASKFGYGSAVWIGLWVQGMDRL